MKRTLLYTLIATAVFASCRKDSHVFSESPDVRINKVLAAYQDSLINAPYGWKALIFPAGFNGGSVGFYFKFNNSNRVEMFSDFDSLSGVTVMQSSYRLKALQQPSLIFDTYSYVSVLADPDASVNGGTYGNGLLSDFEFAIDTIGRDTIRLIGRLHSSKAYLVKATQQEMNDFYNKKHTNRLFPNLNKYITYFKRITVGGVVYEILTDTQTRKVTISWVDGTGPHVVTTGYYYTATGIGFATPIGTAATVFYGFDNITFDATNIIMTVTVNGTKYTVNQATAPVVPDLTALDRFRTYAMGQGSYWISLKGFHINGIDDALGITTIPNYYYMIYLPGYGVSGNTPYDVWSPIKLINNGLELKYGFAYRVPTTTSGGRNVFPLLGVLRPDSIPTVDSIPVAKTRIQFADNLGYYFVQRDTTTFDMVGARDGKAWLRWEQ